MKPLFYLYRQRKSTIVKKYRIDSARLKTWDYRNNGAYFITIITKNRINHFGEIVNANMILSAIGNICQTCLCDTNRHFPFAQISEYVVMPDHIHAIIRIEDSINEHINKDNRTGINVNSKFALISPKQRSLGSIIRSFKSAVSKQAHLINSDFAWQPRFHDMIIRDSRAYLRYKGYILLNVEKYM